MLWFDRCDTFIGEYEVFKNFRVSPQILIFIAKFTTFFSSDFPVWLCLISSLIYQCSDCQGLTDEVLLDKYLAYYDFINFSYTFVYDIYNLSYTFNIYNLSYTFVYDIYNLSYTFVCDFQ